MRKNLADSAVGGITLSRRSIRPVTTAVLILLLSQVLLYPPGSDVSPYAFTTGQLRSNAVAGVSVQTLALALLAVVVATGLLRRERTQFNAVWVVWAAIFCVSVSALFAPGSLGGYLDGIGKVALPLLLYLYLTDRLPSGGGRDLALRLITVVQVFCIGQVFIAYVVTGSFGANTYYHELSQEYFGYFHHPFALAGTLGICALVSVFRVASEDHPKFHIALIGLSLWLIVASQVRTYIVAIGVAMVCAIVVLLARKRRAVWALPLLIIAGIVAIPFLPLSFAGDRVTGDLSSGRVGRWSADISAFIESATPAQLIFGGGPGHIARINEQLFGVSINSLNFVIDILVDFGVVGLVLFISAWCAVLRDASSKGDSGLVASLTVFMVLGGVLSNVFDFSMVVITFAIALTTFRADALDPRDARLLTPATAVR